MKKNDAPKAPVFQIVNGSFVDGFGIRTTIFLKGCLLKCKWCCNPEGQSFVPEPRYISDHCVDGCSRCVDACPQHAISITDKKLRIKRELCDGCGRCEEACWEDAMRMYGIRYTPQDIMKKILREKPYMIRSGGGLTIGGGEATCYSAFCRQLISLCHKEQIPVAIDSCGYPYNEDTKAVLREADLVLFDLKGMDTAKHYENTGVGNEEILQSFAYLRSIGKPVIVRIPLIPGLNDDRKQLHDLGKLLRDSPNVKRVDLMPYHEYGVSKYREIGLDYPLGHEIKPYEKQEIDEILSLIRSYVDHVQIGG